MTHSESKTIIHVLSIGRAAARSLWISDAISFYTIYYKYNYVGSA